MTLLQAALTLHDAGCAVIPVKNDGTKAPAVAWKAYITQRADRAQIEAWYAQGSTYGIGVITGHTSQNLEMAELEGRAAAHMTDLADLATASGLGDLWHTITTGWLELSPSGGIHLHYRVTDTIAGNTKLARDASGLVLAETRGEGGYVVVAPTPGTHHPSGQPWLAVQGSATTCPTITPDQRDALHTLLRTLDRTPVRETPPPASIPRPSSEGTSPGDDYENRTSWADILTPAEWTHVYTAGRTTYWRRPGKDIGISATTGHADDRDRLYVFTTSTDFEAEHPYTKFGAYALLHHGGDHSAAARALRANGYGNEPTTATTSGLEGLIAPTPNLTLIHSRPATDGANALAPQPAATHTLERSEDGHAQQLIATYGNLIRYCPQRGAWLAWNGHVWEWQPKSGGVLREYAKTVARGLPTGDNPATSHKRRALSAAGTSGCLEQAKTDPRITVAISQLDADPWMLNTPAGLIDLRTGQTMPPDPGALVTKTTTATPNFADKNDDWEAFLTDTFAHNNDLAGYVQRLFGISLIGSVREQVLPFAHGLGANGKSTLLEAVMHAVGVGETGYAIAAPAEMLMIRKHSEHPAELAQLAGSRLVVCSELDDGQRFAEAKIKQLTGRDSINARFLYGQPFTFTPTHTIWLLGNHRPQAATGGLAFWRRVKLLEFANTVPKENRDPALGDKLAAAAGHILAWAINGAIDYVASGIREPAAVEAATTAYAEDQDTVARFVSDLLQLTPGVTSARVKAPALRGAYEAWCDVEGENPVSPKRFTQELGDRFGVGVYRVGRSRGYTGLVLLDGDGRDEPEGRENDEDWYR